MPPQPDYRYDVFISYSRADEEWVATWLAPRLEGAGLRVALRYRVAQSGEAIVTTIERLIQASRRTVAVVTPEWLASEWNAFEDVLVRTLDPAARKRKLIPILLKPCPELPASLTQIEAIDLRAERRWTDEVNRLTRDLRDTVPVALPWQQDKALTAGERWRRWLGRYRRQVRAGVGGAIALWLLLALSFQFWPFQPRLGWQALSPPLDQAWRFGRAGDVLLVSSKTDFDNGNCKPADNTGLWRSTDAGATWTAILAPELEVTRLDRQCDISAFSAFAAAPADPQRVYAATFEAGVLRSDDAGLHWRKVGADDLPARLTRIVAAAESPDTVLVAAERGGLYRTEDGGATWQRLDAPGVCAADAEAVLPVGFEVGALAAAPGRLYAGSAPYQGPPGAADGLYASTDRGRCWRRIDDAAGRYKYRALAAAPATNQILALTFDFRAPRDKPEEVLWLIEEGKGRLQSLWEGEVLPQALLLSPGPPATWFLATDRGQVIRGALDRTLSETTPLLLSCVLNPVSPMSCETALAPDPTGELPLLLAHDRVYRRGIVPWIRTIWPPR